MPTLRRTLATVATAAALVGATLIAPTAASASTSTSMITAGGGATCTDVRELGAKKVVWDKGVEAFTVRQYIGYCSTSSGSGWRNFASVYVWKQYHDLGFDYRAMTGVAIQGVQETSGFVLGANRQRLTYSAPVSSVLKCTQGWGKLYRSGSESSQGLTSLVC
jgi:hypothetical protein